MDGKYSSLHRDKYKREIGSGPGRDGEMVAQSEGPINQKVDETLRLDKPTALADEREFTHPKKMASIGTLDLVFQDN